MTAALGSAARAHTAALVAAGSGRQNRPIKPDFAGRARSPILPGRTS